MISLLSIILSKVQETDKRLIDIYINNILFNKDIEKYTNINAYHKFIALTIIEIYKKKLYNL